MGASYVHSYVECALLFTDNILCSLIAQALSKGNCRLSLLPVPLPFQYLLLSVQERGPGD